MAGGVENNGTHATPSSRLKDASVAWASRGQGGGGQRRLGRYARMDIERCMTKIVTKASTSTHPRPHSTFPLHGRHARHARPSSSIPLLFCRERSVAATAAVASGGVGSGARPLLIRTPAAVDPSSLPSRARSSQAPSQESQFSTSTSCQVSTPIGPWPGPAA
jgi:hypothetical protein